ncbi:HBP1 [Auxenochlorella protothecoides x Auxenochlorella symbiontica]
MTASGQGRDTTDDFLVEDVVAPERPAVLEHETDPHRLAQRQKQVDFGKNTLGYQRYREAIPRSQRRRNKDPSTPDVHKACSKRAFDGQIKKWRRQLHEWDPPTQEAGAADDVALATGAVMSLEAAGPAGREEPAPGGDADGQVIPGSKKGRELRGSGRLLPRLFGRSGTNKRRPDLGSQEGAGGQPDPRATKRGWFTATRAPREAVQAEPGMPEVDYRYWQGRQGGWIWAGSCSRLSHRLNAP